MCELDSVSEQVIEEESADEVKNEQCKVDEQQVLANT